MRRRMARAAVEGPLSGSTQRTAARLNTAGFDSQQKSCVAKSLLVRLIQNGFVEPCYPLRRQSNRYYHSIPVGILTNKRDTMVSSSAPLQAHSEAPAMQINHLAILVALGTGPALAHVNDWGMGY